MWPVTVGWSDQLSFAADEGFWAWEDNTMTRRPAAVQERLGQAMRDLGMTMGVFVANFGTAFGKQSFVNGDVTCDTIACGTDLESTLCTVDNGGHTWPGAIDVPSLGYTTKDIDATEAMLTFFEKT